MMIKRNGIPLLIDVAVSKDKCALVTVGYSGGTPVIIDFIKVINLVPDTNEKETKDTTDADS